jgi:hypothetical protein
MASKLAKPMPVLLYDFHILILLELRRKKGNRAGRILSLNHGILKSLSLSHSCLFI